MPMNGDMAHIIEQAGDVINFSEQLLCLVSSNLYFETATHPRLYFEYSVACRKYSGNKVCWKNMYLLRLNVQNTQNHGYSAS